MVTAASRVRKWRQRSFRPPRAVPVILLVLGSLLVPLALTGVWTQMVLLDTDRYVKAVTPLIGRPPVQEAVAEELAARLLAELDLESRTREVWPDASPALIRSMIEQVDYYTRLLSLQFVQSEEFVPIWSEANREAHASLVNLIDGEGPVRLSPEGTLVIGLDAAAEQLSRRLREANTPLPDSLLPTFSQGDVAIIDVDVLHTVRPLLRTLSGLYIVLPILALLCLLGAVLLSERRLLALALVGVGMVVTMLALEIGLWMGEARYTATAEAARVPAQISQAMWEPLVGSLDLAARSILIVGVGTIIVAGVTALWPARLGAHTR
jgi:hypothetical protein